MASHEEFIEYVREQTRGAGAMSFRRMFGEYACYLDGKVVALVCDDQFYLKQTEAGRRALGEVVLAAPFPGAKPYFRLDAVLEDPDEIARVLRLTVAELPLPKLPRARKPGKAGTTGKAGTKGTKGTTGKVRKARTTRPKQRP